MVKRHESIERPNPIEYLGDGTYYYNCNIVESEATRKVDEESDEEETYTVYSYIQIHLRGKANYTDCVKAVIRAFISESEEFDLVNSYNKYTLGLSSNENDRDKYIEYLQLLSTIKEEVKKDFNN